MALSTIVKKASSLLRLGSSDSLKPPPLDGEIIYCKNNVCVHPPASLLLDSEHHPGYLTLRAHQNEVRKVLLNKKKKNKNTCMQNWNLTMYIIQFTFIKFYQLFNICCAIHLYQVSLVNDALNFDRQPLVLMLRVKIFSLHFLTLESTSYEKLLVFFTCAYVSPLFFKRKIHPEKYESLN